MCTHNSIATRVCLANRGIQVNTTCPVCLQAPETIIHALRVCSLASSCWPNLEHNKNFGCDGLLDFTFLSSYHRIVPQLSQVCVGLPKFHGSVNLPITISNIEWELDSMNNDVVGFTDGVMETNWILTGGATSAGPIMWMKCSLRRSSAEFSIISSAKIDSKQPLHIISTTKV
ncbi:hypothetical protein CFP56_026005 [Quercus suber]|uniref:Reverse transcriptase zinc-binding domain-containing protein n=1 Tax=Quercus suber TaxID=58331 RepID=A0AAW0LZN4_QUESU